MRLDLNGLWKLQHFTPGEGEQLGVFEPQFPDSDWYPTSVPGEVHATLRDLGVIADPYEHGQIEACAWMEERTWWYRRSFSIPPGSVQPDTAKWILTFEGLDTFATIYLDGTEIATHGNMFRPLSVDVSPFLTPGEHVLAVRFVPPLQAVEGKSTDLDPRWTVESAWRVWMRKAQMSYGWDWGPRLPAIGIWQGVHLDHYSKGRLTDFFFRTLEIRDRTAIIAIEVEAEHWTEGMYEVQVELLGHGKDRFWQIPLRSNKATLSAVIEDPALWWTHELGEPALYTLRLTLLADGEPIDRQEERVGIRTIELDQHPDPDEVGCTFFTFRLNGIPIFAKGANWIPADAMIGAVDKDRYRLLLEWARDAHMTMIRVWGGGVYEKPEFYRLCDEMGILVWQDFMFACAPYPDHDPSFVEEVKLEAEAVVRRLRNHPSLALWCGNNENDWIADQYHWDVPGRDFPGKTLYHEILPSVTERLDGTRPYWPSSPYGGDDHNDERHGDRHNWQVWHGQVYPRRFGEFPDREFTPEGVSFRHYSEDLARFVSEFGMHASPAMPSLLRMLLPDQRHLGSEGLLYRNKDMPKDKGNQLLLAHTGLPKTLEEYVILSMLCQAEGLQFGIEHYRRRKPHCSGALFWQLNDCWPGLSWSVIDYYGRPKAGYFYVRRAFSPVIASLFQTEDGIEVWGINDTLSPVQDTLTILHGTFDGRTLHQTQINFKIPPNSAFRLQTLPWTPSDPTQEFIALRSHHRTCPPNRLLFAEIKDLKRPTPSLKINHQPLDNGRILYRLTTDHYALFVHFESPWEDLDSEDNFFDLLPGESREVTLWRRSREPIDPQQISIRAL